jgi:hypothetical protein
MSNRHTGAGTAVTVSRFSHADGLPLEAQHPAAGALACTFHGKAGASLLVGAIYIASIFENACKLGLEGIVSKRINASYRSGKVKTWLKTKNKKAAAWLRVQEAG